MGEQRSSPRAALEVEQPVVSGEETGRGSDAAGDVLLWVEPALDAPSGGLRYNQQVREALSRCGVNSRVLSLRGSWPHPSEEEAASAVEQLHRAEGGSGVRAVIVDGLIGGCVPELLEVHGEDRAYGGTASAVLLVHLCLAGAAQAELAARSDGGSSGAPESEEPPDLGRERRAVEAAETVLTTSHWSAEDLRRRYGRGDAVVAVPGTRRAGADDMRSERGGQEDLREGSAAAGERCGSGRVLRLTCVASMNLLKNQRFLAEVLESLQDVDWTLTLAGAGADTAYGRSVLADLRRRLPRRVEHRGVLEAEDLRALWSATDLLLLPSRLETYGMVVTEACANGVPAFVSAGTGAEEALGEAEESSGWALPLDEPQSWTRAIRDFLTEPSVRAALADGVSRRRVVLPTWEQSAKVIASAAGLGGSGG